jgi:PAS domain S-box-containing protein
MATEAITSRLQGRGDMRIEDSISHALELAGDGALVSGPDGRIALWNRAAERLLGWTRTEALGRATCELLEADPNGGRPGCHDACPVSLAALKGEDVESFEVQARTKTGRPLRLNVSTLSLNGGARNGGPVTVHLFRATARPATLAGGTPTSGAHSDNGATGGLTPRELEVLRLLATGANTRMSAERLGVSPATVRNHVQNLLGKLGVHSRLQAVAYANTHGLL